MDKHEDAKTLKHEFYAPTPELPVEWVNPIGQDVTRVFAAFGYAGKINVLNPLRSGSDQPWVVPFRVELKVIGATALLQYEDIKAAAAVEDEKARGEKQQEMAVQVALVTLAQMFDILARKTFSPMAIAALYGREEPKSGLILPGTMAPKPTDDAARVLAQIRNGRVGEASGG